jgi:two-component system chemotaxis response regulator CheY
MRRQQSDRVRTSRRASEAPGAVFVVDDNELTRRALTGIVGRDERLTVIGEASNGVLALKRIHALEPDVVCLDVLMPRLDGMAVLRSIREKLPRTAVIIITAESTPEVVAEARKLGAEAFLVKPFNAAKVLSTIHGVLARGVAKTLAA